MGSRFTHTAEANYSTTEGELLVQADALHKTKYFTLGCPKLILETDQMPLLGLLANRNLDFSIQTLEQSPDEPSVRQHLIASSGTGSTHSKSTPPLLLDEDTH